MPYCEFLIKSKAFRRMEIDKWRHTRKIAFHAFWSANVDGKNLPKNENDFINLDDDHVSKTPLVSDELRKQMLEETAIWVKKRDEYNRLKQLKTN